MSEKKKQLTDTPDVEVIKKVLDDEYYSKNYHSAIRSTVFTLIIVVALALLVATLMLPVVRIYGNTMEPTISEDSIVLCRKSNSPLRGDVIAFYYNNKILVRRVIATSKDVVIIDKQGKVQVNDQVLSETYVSMTSQDKGNQIYPYQVPEGEFFVLADNRCDTTDSRDSRFGCIKEEDIIGKVMISVWPLKHFGLIK